MQDKAIKQYSLLIWMVNLRRGAQYCVLFFLCVFCCFSIKDSDAKDFDQSTLKALYTYKFGKFTEWPDVKLNSTTEHFHFCILGQNQFSSYALSLIKDKTVQEKPLFIAVFDSGLVHEEVLTGCHILFISKSEKHRLSTILTQLKHSAILTISDIADFSSKGGMITLVEDQGKLRFQINPKSLASAKISISSKIIELAEIIIYGQSL